MVLYSVYHEKKGHSTLFKDGVEMSILTRTWFHKRSIGDRTYTVNHKPVDGVGQETIDTNLNEDEVAFLVQKLESQKQFFLYKGQKQTRVKLKEIYLFIARKESYSSLEKRLSLVEDLTSHGFI